ncbi:MAG: hypothetical protein HC830_00265 [Bacteroidetes bacterium]|nr:hypothetical protein [Bacteroidota bacterium]
MNIPDSLKTKADAVVRYHITRYTRLSLEKATEYHKYAITVFNKNGDKFSDLSIFYDNSTVIREINGTLYNALGIVVSN